MGVWSRLRRTFRAGSHSSDIQEELEFHLAMDAEGGRAGREGRLRLGNRTRIEEEARSVGIIEWIESAMQDARYGLRQLQRAPLLTLAVVLSLAIGVGANTAIFSLVDAAILRPLPVKDPGALRIVEWTNEAFPPGIENHNGEYRSIGGGRNQGSSIAASLYRQFANRQAVFEPLMGIAAYPDNVAVTIEGSPAEQIGIQYVSSNLFQGVGAMPIAGRPFREEDDRVGQEPVVIVSHRFWKAKLGGVEPWDRKLRINNVAARIVGVAPPGFFGLRTGQWPDFFAPLAATVAFQPGQRGSPRGENDRNWWVRPIGRLKPGVVEAAAKAELDALFRNLIVSDGVHKVPEAVLLPGSRGISALNTRDTDALRILMLLVSVLLLIVCANVANLLLSRSVSRQRESAVRLAIGAARSRLFRQHLIESGILALLGGAAGLGLGYAIAQSIHVLFQTGQNASNAFDLHIDPRILAFNGMISILTALLFGMAPAVRAARADLGVILKAQTRSVMGGLRLPRVLVSVQIALCLAALVAAGLLGRSLEKLKWLDVGFDRNHLAYASVSPSQAGYPAGRIEPYFERVRRELAAVPGVVGVTPVATRLIAGGGNNGAVNLPGAGFIPSNRANINRVGEEFFEMLGIPLATGRKLERRDLRLDSEGVVVDDLFARQYFPNQNPLGRRFGMGPDENSRYEIVGVVANSRYNNMRGDAVPGVYQLYRPGGTIHFAIRTAIDPAGLAPAIRRAIAAVDAAVPLAEFHTQTGLIDRTLRTERMLGFVSGGFCVIALTLAAVGLCGLLGYAVARRTNEIGVRMALGAASGDVVRMVLRDSLWTVGAGIVIGVPCAYAIGQYLRSSLFRLEPLDPVTAGLSFAALVAVAVAAAWIPARRAAGIDPMTALREE